MVIAGTWDYQEGRTHGTSLAGTPWAGVEPWRVLPLVAVVVVVEECPIDSQITRGTWKKINPQILSFLISYGPFFIKLEI